MCGTRLPLDTELSVAAEPFEVYGWGEIDDGYSTVFGEGSTLLIGCYKNKKQKEWIQTNGISNIRLGKRKGSADNETEKIPMASYLILYDVTDTRKQTAYRILSHQERTGKELIAMAYPNRHAGKRYMTFDIAPLDQQIAENIDGEYVDRMLSMLPKHINGAPIFITP